MNNDKVQEIETKARGNWQSILMSLGIPDEIFIGKEKECFNIY